MAHEKILVIDDDEDVLKVIKRTLTVEKMDITTFTNGIEAIDFLKENEFDLILLDVILDVIDGFEILKRIRKMGINTPILMLSGRDEDYNTILGLGLGADDYITKPFNFGILSAKIKAHIRRSQIQVANIINLDTISSPPFRFEYSSYRIFKNETEINLSSKETMIMKLFIENENKVFSKEQLYQKVWGNEIVDDNTVMVHIRHLRSKIEDNPASPQYIKTIWGVGYKFSTTE